MDSSYLQTFLEKFEHLKIKLEDITTATNNFDDQNNRIGVGGFGNVYKGEVSHSKGRSMVAIKRLDPKRGQGIPEFLKEISMLSSYTHENLISLLGFCCEAKEMILVYELASGGSLDHHLNSPHLTWTQRLKICLDAAKGLSYLHDPRKMHQRLIHCDIKSGNILLDDKWNAKISDFGLSTMGSANEQQSTIVTVAAGTEGYIDPQFRMTHTLTKESDVYSFGVVLFEVLCGTRCCTYKNQRVEKNFVPTWIQRFEKKEQNNIIFKNPNLQPMDEGVLQSVSDIAYRCLNVSREDRPSMAKVVKKLEIALEMQEFSENKQIGQDRIKYYKEKAKFAQPPLNYVSNGELMRLMCKGVLLNDKKTWFSINKKGEHSEMISFTECLGSGPSEFDEYELIDYRSRFVDGMYDYKNPTHGTRFSLITNAVKRMFKVVPSEKENQHSEEWMLKSRVKAQFLSPGITYAVNFVFNFKNYNYHDFISLSYKLKGEGKTSVSYHVRQREDKWYMAELYQFVSDQRTIDLEILFGGYNVQLKSIHVEGIEFCPLEKVEHKDEKHSILDSTADWEETLPSDFEDMMKLSKDTVQWTTEKEAYKILRKGFLTDSGETWVYLDKNGKKCYLISARAFCLNSDSDGHMFILPESRFGEAFKCNGRFRPKTKTRYDLLSFETSHEVYLVYRLPKDQSKFEGPMEIVGLDRSIFLVNPLTPVIRSKADQTTHSPVSGLISERLSKQRDDGWMEVQIGHFNTLARKYYIYRDGNQFEDLRIIRPGNGEKLNGLIVEGIEFRPK